MVTNEQNERDKQKLVRELTSSLKKFPLDELRVVEEDVLDRSRLVWPGCGKQQKRNALLRIIDRAQTDLKALDTQEAA